MKIAFIWATGLLVLVIAGVYFLGSHAGTDRAGLSNPVAWQRMTSPGPLSEAHAFLEHDCAACHTPIQGADDSKCIACHANETTLLKRQPTAFHGEIGSCKSCHLEHQGFDATLSTMDHQALATIGLDHMRDGNGDEVNEVVLRRLSDWIADHRAADPIDNHGQRQISIEPEVAVLNCASCHTTASPHRGLLGKDCAQCHGVTDWSIPSFRHPSSSSKDCSQCHQAPPSHYMMHFKMISAKVAKQPSAKVDECFECHQTTSWNDIRGVGWYKHH